MNRKNVIKLVVAVLFIGLLITAGTFSFLTWTSNVNKNVVFNTASNLQKYITYDEGNSAFSGSLEVGTDYTYGIHSTISMMKSSEAANATLMATIYMDINAIGPNMKNSPALKWAVTSGNATNPGSTLSEGNFIGANNGDVLTLLNSIEVTTTRQEYTIWIWLDASMNPSDSLSGETLDTNVWTEINQLEGIDEEFEITRISANYQTITATAVNSKYNITGYKVTNTETEPSTFTTITGNNKVYNISETVNSTGTYYVWFKDSNNTVIHKPINVETVDTSKPSCSWGAFNPASIANGETAKITLTCTDTESSINSGNLKTSDITVSSDIATVSNITKSNTTNGYIYTITVTGTSTDGDVTLTLPANKVSNGVGLKNNAVTSGTLAIFNAEPPSTPTWNAYYVSDNTIYTSGTWSNSRIYTEISAESLDIAVSKFQYSLDNNTWTDLTCTHSGGIQHNNNIYSCGENWDVSDGRNDTIYFRAVDPLGRMTDSSTGVNIKYDIIGPVGSIETNGMDGALSATVNATDALSGLAEQYYFTILDSDSCDSNTTGFIDNENNSTYNFTINTAGTHYICAKVMDNAGNAGYISKLAPSTYYTYTGNYQLLTVPETGYYYVETWGAQGGGNGGKGGYTSGYVYMNEGEQLYVYVGGQGVTADSTAIGGYNGGGGSTKTSRGKSGATGGGATDIRYFGSTTPSSTDLVWNSTLGLNSRIMVAAGGGHAVGGGLHGFDGELPSDTYYAYSGKGAVTNSGGAAPTKYPAAASNGTAGSFGIGGNGGASSADADTGGGQGAGGGYYGGSGASGLTNGSFLSGSGSSFISGFAGVNAITSASSRTHTNNTNHYSGKYFIDTEMVSGTNTGNGKAKITYYGPDEPTRVNPNLNGVRYIRDCVNGSSANPGDHWVEMQAIKNGVNLAKGKSVTGTSTQKNNTNYAYANIVDGQISNTTGSSGYGYPTDGGSQCVTIDLTASYNLDEVAVWHYFADDRTYYDNVTYVSSDGVLWKKIISNNDAETANGKRINAWEYMEPVSGEVLYTGGYQEFVVPTSGYYKIEAWGAEGGSAKYSTLYTGGKGGYTSGYVYMNAGEKLYIYVGGMGSSHSGTSSDSLVPNGSGYNGGNVGFFYSDNSSGGGGGGSTDIRYFGSTTPSSSDLAWNSTLGLNSRIMVAAGGGGADSHKGAPSYSGNGGAGGGLFGSNAVKANTTCYDYGEGAKQTTGGNSIACSPAYAGNVSSNSKGTFGVGGSYHAGGGSGYYGGGAGTHASAGGGSSFISGLAGVNAITSASSRTHTNNTNHYSTKYFIDTAIASGVNTGNGSVKIDYYGPSEPTRVNPNFNGVRYIADCINGSSADSSNQWVEMQAIKNGVNLAKGKTPTVKAGLTGSTLTAKSGKLYTYATDGIIDTSSYAEPNTGGTKQCMFIDLGSTYNLDEVAVWHYFGDARTYTDNVTYVSSDNSNWTILMAEQEIETANGKRINAWDASKVYSNLTVNPNGGSFNGSTSTVTYLGGYGTLRVLPRPLRTGYTFTGWTKSENGTLNKYGTGLYDDETFASGTNSFSVYNNSGNGTVVHTRVAKASDSPMNNTSYMMQIKTSGAASPGLGGFAQITNSRADAIFYHVIVAKIPVGYKIDRAANSTGTGTEVTWLTSTEGTGKFETYIYKHQCGSSGTFSTFGYVYITGSAATSSNPVTWYVAYSNIFDATNGTSNQDVSQVFTYDSGDTTLTANWSINTYTITYNANGGSGAPESQSYVYDPSAQINLSSTVPTNGDYTFLGWSLSSSATSASYSPGQAWNRSNANNYTLYAVWKGKYWTVTTTTCTQQYNSFGATPIPKTYSTLSACNRGCLTSCYSQGGSGGGYYCSCSGYSCPHGENLSGSTCWWYTYETSTTTETGKESCTPSTGFSSCNSGTVGAKNVTCTQN